MEERLEMVKRMMELEKEKRSVKMANSLDGQSMWRSATTQKTIKGYSDMVLNNHREKQPNLPPTTLIYRDETPQMNTQKSSKGFAQQAATLMNAGKKNKQ